MIILEIITTSVPECKSSKVYFEKAGTGNGFRFFMIDQDIRLVLVGIKNIREFAHFYVHGCTVLCAYFMVASPKINIKLS